jgi:hypothetical protein
MIRAFIASLALSTLCIPGVQATNTPFTENDLLSYFEDHGGRVYVDSDLCYETYAMGLMVGGNTIHLCTSAHQGDTEEYKDTIRHEVWHVVQACNNGPIHPDPIKTIVAAHNHGWTGEFYPRPETWHYEAEAHVVAAALTPLEIKNAIDTYCLE